jgi:hypothetical protein
LTTADLFLPVLCVAQVCMCVMHLRPTGKEDEAGGWKGAKAMSEFTCDTLVVCSTLQHSAFALTSLLPRTFPPAVNDQNFLRSLKLYEKDRLTDKSA